MRGYLPWLTFRTICPNSPPDPSAPSPASPPISVVAEDVPIKHPIRNQAFFVLELACLPLALWWISYSHLPPPGWAVAFIAGAAAAMSVHDDMKGWQKGLWMLIIGAFLVTELRAIHKDRIEAQQQAIGDRNAQDGAFAAVRKTQNDDFSATALGLTTAIDGIKSTLTAANTTLLQTQPRAALHLDKIEFTPIPSEILPDIPYTWNYHFTNAGTATATNVVMMQRIFVGRADDKDAQLSLVDRFNKEWKTGGQKSTVVIVPNVPLFNTLNRTFSKDELQDFSTKTIYFMFRYEYSDESGRWRMDECKGLQRDSPATIDTSIFHVCDVFVNARYRVKRR
jgi:hypothetical protein